MKKFISIFAVFVMMMSTMSTCSLPAFAQTTTKYWQPRPNSQNVLGCVNDEPDGDAIYIVRDDEYDASRIEYLGDGKLTGWEFPTLAEDRDYEVIKQYDNIIIVKFFNGCPYINALVDFGNEAQTVPETQAETQGQNDETVSDNTDGTNTSVAVASDSLKEFTTEKTMIFYPDLKSDNAPASTQAGGTKAVIIGVAVGAAVCSVVLAAVKLKKSHSK